MKKIIATILAAASVMTASAAVLAEEPIKILVNDVQISFDAEPFIENDRTLVPMRAIFEALGAQVAWDGEDRTVISYDPVSDVSITMQIDSDVMFVGETAVKLDVPAKIVSDRTFVPLRAISESMNSEVNWDGATRTVTIEKSMEAVQVENPWVEYETIDELNAALNEADDIKYGVADIAAEGYTVKAYRYMPTTNMTEIIYSFKDDGGEAEVAIRMMPGDTDISVISGGTKIEDCQIEGSAVEIYKYEDITYAIWACEDVTVYSHSVAVETTTMSEENVIDFVKALVESVEQEYPKG
ncbi:MAG: copper amine oxidase N-terminal domain-containing protein [Clostridia bacterium]|nr:copper amine oxidase N-terminal domain-containing protein [Clostridia bacterium]